MVAFSGVRLTETVQYSYFHCTFSLYISLHIRFSVVSSCVEVAFDVPLRQLVSSVDILKDGVHINVASLYINEVQYRISTGRVTYLLTLIWYRLQTISGEESDVMYDINMQFYTRLAN